MNTKKGVLVCVLLFGLIGHAYAIDPGKNLITMSVSLGMKGAVTVELGYEYSLNEFIAPQISVGLGLFSHHYFVEGNINFYFGYLHLSTPFDLGFQNLGNEQQVFMNWTPGLGIAYIDAPKDQNGKYGGLVADFGWTIPVLALPSSFFYRGGLNFSLTPKGQFF